MASVVKRKNKYAVVYFYNDEKGKKRQKWETFNTKADAKNRKSQIEFEQSTGDFIVPTAKTIRDLLEEYVSVYGVSTWALSTYDAHRRYIDCYINPIIGDMKLCDVTPRVMDKFYKDLLKVKAKTRSYQSPDTCITPRTVRDVHKTLRNAFNQAVRWELMTRNPVLHANLPKHEPKPRDIWTVETLFKATELCDDPVLSLAINLSFSCSLRAGEILGLTWDCVDISQESIESGIASVHINKEIQRVSKKALEILDKRDVVKIFPSIFNIKSTALPKKPTTTSLVLKSPKTKTSVRKVFLPKTVAEMLITRKQEIEEIKEFLGNEFTDHNLVFCNTWGRPLENSFISTSLDSLIKEHNLPKVVFHSLRHSSITYKLKINGGDVKSVQGDSGHSQARMVTDVYSHILDNDRQINAQRFEKEFYSKDTEEKNNPQGNTVTLGERETLLKLLDKPEMAALLKILAQNM